MDLRNLWYHALPAHALKPGTMRRLIMLNEPVLVGRSHGGAAFALRDMCPHRGVPLSAGSLAVNGQGQSEIECPYHGWRFASDGQCTVIPSLLDNQALEPGRIRVRRYPVAEKQGNIWVCMTEPNTPVIEDKLPPPPEMPAIGAREPNLVVRLDFACTADQAVLGLIDPAHGPYVHGSRLWRTKASIHEKAKRFGPAPLGFTMLSHKPSKNSLAYRILGGDLETEISFFLPGTRVELVRSSRHAFVGLTTITPVDEAHCVVAHVIYWTMPWLSPLKPLLRPLARRFLGQDQGIFGLQGQNMPYEPRAIYVDDADTQIKWYYRLKKEWSEALAEGRAFVNPVTETTLRWRT